MHSAYPVIHVVLLVFGVVWGIALCAGLIIGSLQAGKRTWLMTIPAILVIAFLGSGFVCQMLHWPTVVPYRRQISAGIHQTLSVAVVPLLLLKLYELWRKKRTKPVPPQEPSH